jgi:hypothetical protein
MKKKKIRRVKENVLFNPRQDLSKTQSQPNLRLYLYMGHPRVNLIPPSPLYLVSLLTSSPVYLYLGQPQGQPS